MIPKMSSVCPNPLSNTLNRARHEWVPQHNKAKIYQHVGISNAKFWHWGHCPMPTPDARYFVSQWNIGFNVKGAGSTRGVYNEVLPKVRVPRTHCHESPPGVACMITLYPACTSRCVSWFRDFIIDIYIYIYMYIYIYIICIYIYIYIYILYVYIYILYVYIYIYYMYIYMYIYIYPVNKIPCCQRPEHELKEAKTRV